MFLSYLEILIHMECIFLVLSINYFPQLHASLDRFPQPDCLHVFYAIDGLISHVVRVKCVSHVQEQLSP